MDLVLVMFDENAIEGYFLISKDDLIFDVKGVIHPKNRIVAYLRYIPWKEGNERVRGEIVYRKVYNLEKREEYLREHYPKYLWFDDTIDREVQSVSHDDIAFVMNPIAKLGEFRDRGRHLNPLQHASLNLVEQLVKHSHINWSDIGITGSQLVGLDKLDSDIDLVVYGEKSGRRIHSMLKSSFSSVKGLKHYTEIHLDEITKQRWGKANNFAQLRVIEAKKSLHGLFLDRPFFIRLVKSPSEIGVKHGDMIYKNMGSVSTECTVVNDSDRIFTPCTYVVECDKGPDVRRLISYRGRFTEHVRNGMKVLAKGRLEFVKIIATGEEYLQLVLGESPSDLLLPIF